MGRRKRKKNQLVKKAKDSILFSTHHQAERDSSKCGLGSSIICYRSVKSLSTETKSKPSVTSKALGYDIPAYSST